MPAIASCMLSTQSGREIRILQWFLRRQALGEGEALAQDNPFGPITVRCTSRQATPLRRQESSPLETLLLYARRRLRNRDYTGAEDAFVRCLNYHFLPEAFLGLARCCLLRGYADQAVQTIANSIDATLQRGEASEPDPLEWALYIVGLLCQGNVREAARRATQFSSMAHSKLDRVRLAASAIADHHPARTRPSSPSCKLRASIHGSDQGDDGEYIEEIRLMLIACGQAALAERLCAGLGNLLPQECGHFLRSRQSVFWSGRPADVVLPLIPRSLSMRILDVLSNTARRSRTLRRIADRLLRRNSGRDWLRLKDLPQLRSLDEFCIQIRGSARTIAIDAALLFRNSYLSNAASEFIDARDSQCKSARLVDD